MIGYKYKWKRSSNERDLLKDCLPLEGVSKFFKSEDARRQKFIKIRWPDGVNCLKCKGHDGWWFSDFSHWECKSCGTQVSPTSNTELHGTHLDLEFWFRGTEILINRNWLFVPAVQNFADLLGVHLRTATRVRKIIVEDIEQHGLLTQSVCVIEPK